MKLIVRTNTAELIRAGVDPDHGETCEADIDIAGIEDEGVREMIAARVYTETAMHPPATFLSKGMFVGGEVVPEMTSYEDTARVLFVETLDDDGVIAAVEKDEESLRRPV